MFTFVIETRKTLWRIDRLMVAMETWWPQEATFCCRAPTLIVFSTSFTMHAQKVEGSIPASYFHVVWEGQSAKVKSSSKMMASGEHPYPDNRHFLLICLLHSMPNVCVYESEKWKLLVALDQKCNCCPNIQRMKRWERRKPEGGMISGAEIKTFSSVQHTESNNANWVKSNSTCCFTRSASSSC